jgi:hypothetical protein
MAKQKPNKKKKKIVPHPNSRLPGFDIKIDTFGEIESSYDIETVNSLLNLNLKDKKLKNNIEKEKESDIEDKEDKKEKE